jgi:hypothetical protein
MSYKYTVLQDKPTSFYLLDEVRSGTVGSYDSMRSIFATYADLRDNGVSYSALSGLPMYDYSGNGLHGYAINSSNLELMPLISGGVRGTTILSDTVLNFNSEGIATKYYADDSFTIEAWCLISDSSSLTKIVGDSRTVGSQVQNIGLFHKNSNIMFIVGDYIAEYPVTTSESLHIAGCFNGESISLYLNGEMVDKVSVDKYRFTNTSVFFQTGPSPELMIIDCVAFYKFSLPAQNIKKHYEEGINELSISQIVNTSGGRLFSMNVSAIKPKFQYSYPLSKSWDSVIEDGISISDDKSYIYIEETEDQGIASYSFTDYFNVPRFSGIDTSQIYWSEDVKGILIEVSLDNQSWVTCTNGSPLPYFNKNQNQISDLLYVRVTLSSSDTTKYLPRLRYINILFFKSKTFYSDNTGSYVDSAYDYSLPEYNSRTLSYNKNNGLRMYNGHGFKINAAPPTRSVEMIFTPAQGQNVLVSAPSKIYEWSQSGAITKSGVSSIYVNGIDRTLETNVWAFLSYNVPHHIVINFSSEATGLMFNQNQADTKSGLGSMYNNLALYPNELNEATADLHYLMYTGNIINTVSDSFVRVLESSSGNNSTPFVITSIEPQSIIV